MKRWRHFYSKYHLLWGMVHLLVGAALMTTSFKGHSTGFFILGLWPLIASWNMKQDHWDELWDPRDGQVKALVDRLNAIRDLDLTVFLLGLTLMLASIFWSEKLQQAGLPMVTVSTGALLITLKTQWEVAVVNKFDV